MYLRGQYLKITTLGIKYPFLIPFLAFSVPMAIRTIPEILMAPFLVGFDTLGFYVPILFALEKKPDLWLYIALAPLYYMILTQTKAVGIPLNLTLKILPPILHGFLGFSIYLYATRRLNWSPKKSLLTTFLATLYFMALRISWDLQRTQLALAFLFIFLAFYPREESKIKEKLISIFSMSLVVMTNHFVAVIMFLIVTALVLQALIKKKNSEARKIIIISLLPAILFLLVLYAFLVKSPYVISLLFPLGWTHLFNSDYLGTILTIISLFIYCYILLLPLSIIGAKLAKNIEINTWIISSLALAFLPTFSYSIQYRWITILTYPLSFYVVEAISNQRSNPRHLKKINILNILMIILSIGFLVMPSEIPFPYFAISQFNIFVPSTMLQNTIPQRDCQDTINALNWLGPKMDSQSCLITHQAFYGWALLYLKNSSQIISYGYNDIEKAVENTSQQYKKTYLIWWIEGQGWYQQNIPYSFEEVYRSNRIAVYEKAN
jgi:hypothetical protein